MPNVTLSITDNLKRKMDKHPEIRWSNAVRTIIEKKLQDFEEAERIAAKSRLSKEDVEKISLKVRNDIGLHAKRLLNESNS